MIPTPTRPIWGILLAAGQGQRYAQQQPGADKLLAPINNQQVVLEASASALAAHTDYAVAIVPSKHSERGQRLQHAGLEIISCSSYMQGMGASLAVAAQFLRQYATSSREPKGVLVALADMPSIQMPTYKAVAHALTHSLIAAPVYQGKRGHPVGFNWSLIDELGQLQGDQGARRLIQQHGFYAIHTHDAGVLYDIDLPEHLAAAPYSATD